jgi:hypothetical protein
MNPNLDMLDQLDFASPDPLMEGDPFLGNIMSGLGSALGGLFGEEEDEFPGMSQFSPDPFSEAVFQENAVMPENHQAAMLMEVLVDRLAEAEGEEEVDQFLPILAALGPLAMKAIPAIAKFGAPLIKKAVPMLSKGIQQIGRQVMRSPHTRQLIRGMPTVARNAAADIMQHYSRTGQLNANLIMRALARHSTRILRVPYPRGMPNPSYPGRPAGHPAPHQIPAIRRNLQICRRMFPQAMRMM